MNLADFNKINVRRLKTIYIENGLPREWQRRALPVEFFLYSNNHIVYAERNSHTGTVTISNSLGWSSAMGDRFEQSVRANGAVHHVRHKVLHALQRSPTSETCAIYAVLFSLGSYREFRDWMLHDYIMPELKLRTRQFATRDTRSNRKEVHREWLSNYLMVKFGESPGRT